MKGKHDGQVKRQRGEKENNVKKGKGWKGETVKGWKGETVKGWRGEEEKRWKDEKGTVWTSEERKGE